MFMLWFSCWWSSKCASIARIVTSPVTSFWEKVAGRSQSQPWKGYDWALVTLVAAEKAMLYLMDRTDQWGQ
ncbi:hypothetical protein B0F90DRAFT_1735777 [Multifurca ochricompacta]|uniref:Uncharacterized protein n=1 Tax=Multifurca ochricompacta TaxID=376703 RepID=A0AAD4QM32_9AGAM|nr:hypothetical protein B0F90DRAFT_1735777 [Multifurca ochricompacta]